MTITNKILKCARYGTVCAAILLSHVYAKAQFYTSPVFGNTSAIGISTFPGFGEHALNLSANKKWFVSSYASLSVGTVFLPGRTANFLSVPIGAQLNRQLNNNLYAFGGLYINPEIIGLTGAYVKTVPGYVVNPYSYQLNPGARMGLMYVNDSRTFSISGSVGVQADTRIDPRMRYANKAQK